MRSMYEGRTIAELRTMIAAAEKALADERAKTAAAHAREARVLAAANVLIDELRRAAISDARLTDAATQLCAALPPHGALLAAAIEGVLDAPGARRDPMPEMSGVDAAETLRELVRDLLDRIEALRAAWRGA